MPDVAYLATVSERHALPATGPCGLTDDGDTCDCGFDHDDLDFILDCVAIWYEQEILSQNGSA